VQGVEDTGIDRDVPFRDKAGRPDHQKMADSGLNSPVKSGAQVAYVSRETLMAVAARALDQAIRVVVAYLDGRRLKGYVYNFSILKDSFDLFPQDPSVPPDGTRVEMRDLKAVFFAKDFTGNPQYQESQRVEGSRYGRKIEAAFSDGETIVGTTEGYNREKPGFFVVPADPKSNNARIFVVNKNVRKIKFI
jgi:hypothetical protein